MAEHAGTPETRWITSMQVFYYLGELDSALTYALGAGSRFDVADQSEYQQTLVGALRGVSWSLQGPAMPGQRCCRAAGVDRECPVPGAMAAGRRSGAAALVALRMERNPPPPKPARPSLPMLCAPLQPAAWTSTLSSACVRWRAGRR